MDAQRRSLQPVPCSTTTHALAPRTTHQDPDQVRTGSAWHSTFPLFAAGQKRGQACTTAHGSNRAAATDGQRRHRALVGSPQAGSAKSTAPLQRLTRLAAGQHRPDSYQPCKHLRHHRYWAKGLSNSPDGTSAKPALSQQVSCQSCPQTAIPWNRQPLRHEASELFRRFPVAGPKAVGIANRLCPAVSKTNTLPQVSSLYPAVSAAPSAVTARAVEYRRSPSLLRTGSLPSSLGGPVRSPPGSARSSSRTSGTAPNPQHRNFRVQCGA